MTTSIKFQVVAMADPFNRGSFGDGWGGFYTDKAPEERAQMRTYGPNAEKFFETFRLPLPSEPRHKAFAPGPVGSHTWGIGESLQTGLKSVAIKPSKEISYSSKRRIEGRPSESHPISYETGRKRHVLDEMGNDVRLKPSDSYTLDSMLQRKARVPEEMRTESRTIHRMAPPGLKGFMGSEYSNDFFKHGATVPAVCLRPNAKDQVAYLTVPK